MTRRTQKRVSDQPLPDRCQHHNSEVECQISAGLNKNSKKPLPFEILHVCGLCRPLKIDAILTAPNCTRPRRLPSSRLGSRLR